MNGGYELVGCVAMDADGCQTLKSGAAGNPCVVAVDALLAKPENVWRFMNDPKSAMIYLQLMCIKFYHCGHKRAHMGLPTTAFGLPVGLVTRKNHKNLLYSPTFSFSYIFPDQQSRFLRSQWWLVNRGRYTWHIQLRLGIYD